MKSFLKYCSLVILLIILVIVKSTLEQITRDQHNDNNNKHEKHKSEQIKEVKPKDNIITINKGESEIILTYNKRKGKSPTSIKVYSINKNNEESDITTSGQLSSSPFQWSIIDSKDNLKSVLGNKVKVELSYNGDKVTKNYKIKYKN